MAKLKVEGADRDRCSVQLIALKTEPPQDRNESEVEYCLSPDEANELGWRLINMAGFVVGAKSA